MSNIGTGCRFSKDVIMQQIHLVKYFSSILHVTSRSIGCDTAHRGWQELGKCLRFLEFFNDEQRQFFSTVICRSYPFQLTFAGFSVDHIYRFR